MSWDYSAYFRPSGGNRVHLAVSNNTPTVSSDNSVSFSYNSSMGIDHSVGFSDSTSVGLSFGSDFSGEVSCSYSNMVPSFAFDFGVEAPALQAAMRVPALTGDYALTDVYLNTTLYQAAADVLHLTAIGPASVTAPSWNPARYAFLAADTAVLLMAMICHGVLQDKGSGWLAKDSGGVGDRRAARDLANTMTAAVPALRLANSLAKLVYGVYLVNSEMADPAVWSERPGLEIKNAEAAAPSTGQSPPPAPALEKSVKVYCGSKTFIELTPEKIVICAPAIELVNEVPVVAIPSSGPIATSTSPITLRASNGDVMIDGKTVTVASQSGTTVRGDVTTEANVTVGKNFTVNGQTTTVKDVAAVKLTAQTGTFG